jgi:hypothetical protein
MRKSKSVFIRYINIRFVKALIYKLLGRNAILRRKFKIFIEKVSVSEVGYDVKKILHEKDLVFISAIVDEAEVIGKTGVSVSSNLEKVIGLQSGNTEYNFVRAAIVKSTKNNTIPTINLLGIRKGHKHFYHIFFDYFIPLYFYLKQINKEEKVEVLVRSDLNQIQLDLLSFFEDEFKEVKFTKVSENEVVKCNTLLFFNHNHFVFYNVDKNPQIKSLMADFSAMLIRKYNISEKPQKRKTYISRSDAVLRRIINEKDLVKFLRDKNFEIHTLSDKKFSDQIELFLNSEIIIAPHGAGFMNLLFCNENTKFLEIFPKKFYNTGMLMLGRIRNLQRYEIIEDNECLKQRFRVNLRNFKNKFSEFGLD